MFSSLPFKFMFFFMMFFGTVFSISSQHWLALWAGLELNLIGFLPALVYQKTSWESESAVKYFIVQALGSGLLILGSLLMYKNTFSWEIILWGDKGLNEVMLISGGLMMKVGLAPFHMWLPSVMAGLPWVSCMLLATWQKVAPLTLLLSLFKGIMVSNFLLLIYCVGGLSSVIGGLGGMNQTQVRALIAYSSIGHMGWMVVSLSEGVRPFLIYFLVYLLISVCLFGSLWGAEMKNQSSFTSLSEVSSLKASILVLMLSLGGLPPMLGFVSKMFVVLNVTGSAAWFCMGLLIFGSLMSLYYYLVLFFSLYIGESGSLQLSASNSNQAVFVQWGVLFNVLGGAMILFLLAF